MSEVKRIIKSLKNDNEYHMYEDRIEVRSRSRTVMLPLPEDKDRYKNYICFTDIFYMGDELNVIVATRDNYDLRFPVDEDVIELGTPTPYY